MNSCLYQLQISVLILYLSIFDNGDPFCHDVIKKKAILIRINNLRYAMTGTEFYDNSIYMYSVFKKNHSIQKIKMYDVF